MKQIVECVPNFSEGRDPQIVAQIVGAMRSVEGARVLDVASDAHHNRTVVTLVGSPAAMEAAAYAGVARAAQLIDMRRHSGEHPRFGATDVVPFIPVRGVTMEDCVAIARRLGERVGRELGIPVYLYESAATRPERRNLADVRRGEYEGLAEVIATDPARAPDFGPASMGAAGAVAVGARPPLVAFNVNLDSRDLALAKAVAREVREATGGLPRVKALGVEVGERVQVTMNLTDYHVTPVWKAYEAVEAAAQKRGATVHSSEIIGLLPNEAIADVAAHALELAGFSIDQVLENRLEEDGQLLSEFVSQVAAATATPGGGAVAALMGALGAALDGMVAGLTQKKEKYAAIRPEMTELIERAARLRAALLPLIAEDGAAFEEVMAAYKLPKDTDEERRLRDTTIARGFGHSTRVPLQVARHSLEALRIAQRLAEIAGPAYICDAGVAGMAAWAGVRGALLNVRVNLPSLVAPGSVAQYSAEALDLELEGRAVMDALDRLLAARNLTAPVSPAHP